jgi:cytochrome c553
VSSCIDIPTILSVLFFQAAIRWKTFAAPNNNKEPPMKLFTPLLVALTLSSATIAADIEAGKAKVQMVCAACHGAMGVSVSDTIPNLAGQRPT